MTFILQITRIAVKHSRIRHHEVDFACGISMKLIYIHGIGVCLTNPSK